MTLEQNVGALVTGYDVLRAESGCPVNVALELKVEALDTVTLEMKVEVLVMVTPELKV